MSGCKLSQSIKNDTCEYNAAGIRSVKLANYYPPVEGDAAQNGAIAYKFDSDGYLSEVFLPTGEVFYDIDASDGTVSFTDALLEGGNGGRYRQHTLNMTIGKLGVDKSGVGDALSLGRFVAFVTDKTNRTVCLGRISGLRAPAGGFDFASGAADADATGWTTILQGTSTEIAPVVKSEAVLSPVYSPAITNIVP